MKRLDEAQTAHPSWWLNKENAPSGGETLIEKWMCRWGYYGGMTEYPLARATEGSCCHVNDKMLSNFVDGSDQPRPALDSTSLSTLPRLYPYGRRPHASLTSPFFRPREIHNRSGTHASGELLYQLNVNARPCLFWLREPWFGPTDSVRLQKAVEADEACTSVRHLRVYAGDARAMPSAALLLPLRTFI